MDSPLISVVTITRNRGNLLKRCITSVLSQTYSNIEHIVVDGASDDNTDDVVSVLKVDQRLKFYKLNYNWPLKETMEYAFSQCSGKYITFLDSDDEYLPTKIEKQVELFESLPNEYGMIYCWMSYYDSAKDNKFISLHNPQLRGFVADEVVEKPVVSGTPTFMFRKEVLVDDLHGWNFDIGIVSDWELGARCCQKYKVDYVPESLVNVYVNHGSLRQSEQRKYYSDADRKSIVYHQYFLTTFADIFRKYPQKQWQHFAALSSDYYFIGEYRNALKYYIKLNKVSCSFNNLVKLPIVNFMIKHNLWK